MKLSEFSCHFLSAPEINFLHVQIGVTKFYTHKHVNATLHVYVSKIFYAGGNFKLVVSDIIGI